MTFHILRNKMKSNQWAATCDQTGQNLPVQTTWEYFKTVGESRIAFDAAKAQADIEQCGFHLFETEIQIAVLPV